MGRSWYMICIGAGLLLAGCGGGSAAEKVVAEHILKLGGSVGVEGADILVKQAKNLTSAPQIRRIRIMNRPLTAADLEPLKELKSVQELTLQNCSVPYELCPIISSYAQLETLDLYKTPFNDEALTQLTGLHKLTKLELSYTRITDASVDKLLEFKRLQTLHLTGTLLTPEGVKRVREGLPRCQIHK